MPPLPKRIDRMPHDTAPSHLRPAQVIAVALNTVPHEWWKRMPVSEEGQVVHAVLDALSKAGLKIVPK